MLARMPSKPQWSGQVRSGDWWGINSKPVRDTIVQRDLGRDQRSDQHMSADEVNLRHRILTHPYMLAGLKGK